MSVFEKVKQIALEELNAKGYAPNSADVLGIAAGASSLVKAEIEKATSELKAELAKVQAELASIKAPKPPSTTGTPPTP